MVAGSITNGRPDSSSTERAGCNESGRGGTPLHSHDQAFNDDILVAGVTYYTQIVRDSLSP